MSSRSAMPAEPNVPPSEGFTTSRLPPPPLVHSPSRNSLPADPSLSYNAIKSSFAPQKMILRRLIDRFDEHLLRDPKGGVGVGDPAVDRRLQQRLGDLVVSQTVTTRRPEVHRQFLVMAAGDQSRQGDQRPAAAVEATSSPDAAPGV